MPIFEYNCSDCDHDFELLVQPSTDPECPECHGRNLEKQFSSFSPGSGSGKSEPTGAPECPTCGIPGGSCGLN